MILGGLSTSVGLTKISKPNLRRIRDLRSFHVLWMRNKIDDARWIDRTQHLHSCLEGRSR